jgi:hypothetical protein
MVAVRATRTINLGGERPKACSQCWRRSHARDRL